MKSIQINLEVGSREIEVVLLKFLCDTAAKFDREHPTMTFRGTYLDGGEKSTIDGDTIRCSRALLEEALQEQKRQERQRWNQACDYFTNDLIDKTP